MLAIESISQMKRSELPFLTVLTGDDVGQFEELKRLFLEKIGYDRSDLNISYFDMKEAPYAEVENDLISLPFFEEEKLVILDHFVDITTIKKRSLSDDELKAFESYIEQPVETTRLIIFAEGKLDSKRRLVKLLKRDGRILEASQPKDEEIRRYFTHVSHEKGLQFAPQVFEELLVKSGFQFSEMTKNLAFLEGYKKTGIISSEDIVEAVPKTLQDNIFDLTQLILNSKIDAARSLVQDLRLQGEDEIKLIAIMLGQFRTFLQVQLLAEGGRGEQQIVADLSHYLGRKVNPFQVKYALRDSRRLSLAFLEASVTCLIETDYQIKSGIYEKDYLFDLALLKISQNNL
ncbi:DNA polymerase III subunit delta [Streptococcus himalayensis]|uniref:DNA polymerase III subunit delta n=1 Tax=Streptococcus himalayensis TaxID=1888195 RepID=A0A917A6M5_9STRE|nr:DNA polymerase III subunit delta [Streptococcus himalayensis]GGE31517.1 DNA polymerase III subunit delta [Streptococcus himalayensis]